MHLRTSSSFFHFAFQAMALLCALSDKSQTKSFTHGGCSFSGWALEILLGADPDGLLRRLLEGFPWRSAAGADSRRTHWGNSWQIPGGRLQGWSVAELLGSEVGFWRYSSRRVLAGLPRHFLEILERRQGAGSTWTPGVECSWTPRSPGLALGAYVQKRPAPHGRVAPREQSGHERTRQRKRCALVQQGGEESKHWHNLKRERWEHGARSSVARSLSLPIARHECSKKGNASPH